MVTHNASDPSQAQEKFIWDQSAYTIKETKLVPRVFHWLLDSSNIPVTRRFYWWRAQVTLQFLQCVDRDAHMCLHVFHQLQCVVQNCHFVATPEGGKCFKR